MNVRFGVSPIAWINDDMPELGAGTSLETVLRDIHELGFEGVELGGAFPREPKALRKLLDAHGLALVGGWYSGSLLERSAEEEWDALQSHLVLLEAMGCSVFIFAETSNAIHGNRGKPLASTPRLPASRWPEFGERMSTVAGKIRERGLRFAYHHHLGTVVERGEDLRHFLENTSPAVGLTLDTGHAALAGIDPVRVIQEHPERIAHVHCKDVRGKVFKRVESAQSSFLDGVLEGMFTAPGDGDLDYAAVMKALAGIDYSGWIIVEAEQDPAKADPRKYQGLGLATLRREANAAGLVAA
jgi:inosose dehydratase